MAPDAEAVTVERVLAEVLATPAFRELLRLNWGRGAKRSLAAATRAALSTEPQLPLELLGELPGATADLFEALVLVGERLASLPGPVREALIGQLADELNARLAEQDWGRAREALEPLIATGGDLLARVAEGLLADPVALANVALLLPAATTTTLRAAERMAGAVAWLPDELLASATINLLGELDASAAGRLLDRGLALLERLHRGNLVLGGDEPALRPVLVDALECLAGELSPGRLARAGEVLGEDGGLVASVILERMARDPEALGQAVRLGARAFGAVCELLSASADAVDALPPEAREDLHRAVRDAAGSAEVARLRRRVIAWLWPQPETLAAWVNQALGRFNRYMAARPSPEQNALLCVVAGLDPAEVEAAWRNVLGLISGTLLARSDKGRALGIPLDGAARALVRPLVAAALDTARLLAGGTLRRLRGRQ